LNGSGEAPPLETPLAGKWHHAKYCILSVAVFFLLLPSFRFSLHANVTFECTFTGAYCPFLRWKWNTNSFYFTYTNYYSKASLQWIREKVKKLPFFHKKKHINCSHKV
jgi:hypothetical protein